MPGGGPSVEIHAQPVGAHQSGSGITRETGGYARSKPESKKPDSPSPRLPTCCACCSIRARSSGPIRARLRKAKSMFRTRTHGHAIPRVHTRRSTLTAQSPSSAPPVTLQEKRAAVKWVWSQKKRRFRATYQTQHRPSVGSVNKIATTKDPKSSRPRPLKANRSLPKYECETMNACRDTRKKG